MPKRLTTEEFVKRSIVIHAMNSVNSTGHLLACSECHKKFTSECR